MTDRKIKAQFKRLLELKQQIKTADEAMAGILDRLMPAGHVQTEPIEATIDGKRYALVDVFAESNHVWRPARVHRWNIEEIKPAKTETKKPADHTKNTDH